MNIVMNKRFIKMILISVFIAAIGTFLILNLTKKNAQPEATESIAYFKNDLERDALIDNKNIETHIEFKQTPVSLIPEGAIKNKNDIKNKRIVSNITKGEHVLSKKLIERGDIKIDAEDLWIIGIDIDNISNFMGVQVKEGNSYELVHIDKDGLATESYKVKLVNIVDNKGTTMTETGTVAPKTLNVGVNSFEEMLKIAQSKRNGNFDVVKPGSNNVQKVAEGE